MAEESQVVEKEEVVGKCCDVCTDDSCGTRRSHVVKIDDENGVSQSYRLSEYLGEIKYHSYLAPCEPHPIEQGDECFCEVRLEREVIERKIIDPLMKDVLELAKG